MIALLILCLLIVTQTCAHPVLVSDIHDIHTVNAAQYFQPTTQQELQDIVTHANDRKMSISIGGKRHTQGGQTLYENGIFVDMTHFNKILHVDEANKLATVQPGATWHDLQQVIMPMNLAVKCMQYFNRFTIGGSLSVNCNSHDSQASILIDTIESIKIITADGNTITADRTQNYDLFRCAIGGYGLFGIIIEATLRLTDNSEFIRKIEVMPTKKYLNFFLDEVKNNNDISFHFARLNTARGSLFDKALVTTCYKPKKETRSFGVPAVIYNATTHPFEFELVRQFDLFKSAHFFIESHLVPKYLRMNRNDVMTLSSENVPLHGTSHVSELEEYFVPVEQLNVFLDQLKPLLKKNKVNLIYFLIRYLPQNTESLLSYAQKDMMSIVMFMTHKRTDAAFEKHKQTARSIIDLVHSVGGTHYLVVHGFASREQIKTSYPMLDEFFANKNQYDPKGIFKNLWFEQYAY